MKVGLVLGAGGIQGGAWLVGGLDALAGETGWDPASAERIVGTSAGSMISALLCGGVPPWFMVAHSRGERFDGVVDATGRPAADADRSGGGVFAYDRGALPIFPGSLGLIGHSLRQPLRHTPAALMAGWAPRGVVSTDSLRKQVRHVVPAGWAPHPELWVVACDYATGRRVPFGRASSPTADLADAVAASCAIPSFYRPVEIGGRLYVDGGMYSTSNLDVLRGEELDLVICLNPTSSLHPTRAWNPLERLAGNFRDASGRRLGNEAKKLRRLGTEVILIQPTGEDLEAMGPNLMSRRSRDRVIEVARRTVAAQLAEPGIAELLAELPQGEAERVRRPDGPPSEWTALVGPQNGSGAQVRGSSASRS
ncbi:MAG: patatin-like phospholipase family protein [Solirubrobacterales bacterium]|nr:patatin-like phospholipase family protein [Solirubrobacterales bacterium]